MYKPARRKYNLFRFINGHIVADALVEIFWDLRFACLLISTLPSAGHFAINITHYLSGMSRRLLHVKAFSPTSGLSLDRGKPGRADKMSKLPI